MDGNKRSPIYQEAKAEIVARLEIEMREELQSTVKKLTHYSINRLAGMMDVTRQTALRVFADSIIMLGNRQQRVSAENAERIIAEYTASSADRRRKALEKARRKIADDNNQTKMEI
jgi:esterase/lipase